MAFVFHALLLFFTGVAVGLRDVQLLVPEAVPVGASVSLGCRWALDTGEALYTVKWYRGAQEFFRYIPKELPNTRVFPQPGITVDVSRSGAQQVVLRDASRALDGRYKCEVSADAPYFHTVYRSTYMRVVALPEAGPRVLAQKSWYSAGDILRANCTVPPADPPANISWYLNGLEVKGLSIPAKLIPPMDTTAANKTATDHAHIIFSPWNAEEPITKVMDTPRSPSRGNYSLKAPVEVTTSTLQSQIKGKTSESLEERATAKPDAVFNKLPAASQLVLRVQQEHFRKGRVNVSCVARVLTAWSARADLLADEERPQLAPVMGSRDSSTASHGVAALALIQPLFFTYWAWR